MSKRGGFAGLLESAGLVEHDGVETERDEAPAAPQPAIQSVPAAQSVTFSPPLVFSPGSTSPALSPEDQERLKSLEAEVYATPSTYVIFKRVRDSIGSSDPKQVFNILAAANPGVTPAKVLADIDTHLGIIEAKRNAFKAQIAQAQHERIDAPTQQIAQLQAANQDAQAQIAARSAQITQLQADVSKAQAAMDAGTQRFKAIEDALSAPLMQAKQQLGAL